MLYLLGAIYSLAAAPLGPLLSLPFALSPLLPPSQECSGSLTLD